MSDGCVTLKSDKDAAISQAARTFAVVAKDLRLKNAFNQATMRDYEAKQEAENTLLETIREME